MENFYVVSEKHMTFWKKAFIILGVCFIFTSGLWLYVYSNVISNQEVMHRNAVQMTNVINELKDEKKINDEKEVMKKDIRGYIKNKYKNIPDSIVIEIAENIVSMSSVYAISTELVVGIMEVESSFNPMATSSKSARGLMQVMPEWSRKFGLKNEFELHNISTGIESGIKVFQIHYEENNNDVSKGLYHYVNKDTAYVTKVYASMGQFVSYRTMSANEETLEVSKKDEVKKEKDI